MRILAFIGMLAVVVGVACRGLLLRRLLQRVRHLGRPGASGLGADARAHGLHRRGGAKDAPPCLSTTLQSSSEGARNYAKYGCANCHGAPGVQWSKFSEGLNPGPPDLSEIAKERMPRCYLLGREERHPHDGHADFE